MANSGAPRASSSSLPVGTALGYHEALLSKDSDPVNHPSHYTAGAIECIDAIEAALTPHQFVGFLRGQVIKYIWRTERKGAAVQDAEKAAWYLARLTKALAALVPAPPTSAPSHIMRIIDHDPCFRKAAGNEPVFVLLGRDASAVPAIAAWVNDRLDRLSTGDLPDTMHEHEHISSAQAIAVKMQHYRAAKK